MRLYKKYRYIALFIVFCIVAAPLCGCNMSTLYLWGYSKDIKVSVSIVDDDTSLPISAANVEIIKNVPFSGRSSEHRQSDSDGLISIKDREDFFGPYLCQVNVEKEEYHPNGSSEDDLYDNRRNQETRRKLKKKLIVRLRKVLNPTQLPLIQGTFYEGDKADILSTMNSRKVHDVGHVLHDIHYTVQTIYYNPSEDKTKEDMDFEFTVIHNKNTNKQDDVDFATIRFFGKGGIQEIPNAHKYLRLYGLENILLAPTEGYSDELTLKQTGQYIARLRDGEHFAKFSLFITDNGKNTPCVKLGMYIQPVASPNLETKDPIMSTW